MSTYIKVGWKYIRKYTESSITMVIIIALSTFLIITIGSLTESSRMTNVNSAKKLVGIQHVRYNRLKIDQVNKIRKNKNVKVLANSSYYKEWNYKDKLSVSIFSADKNILYMDATKISEGRFPTNSNEIAMEMWVLEKLRLPNKLGQTINIPLEEGKEKKFKLVGIINDRSEIKSIGQLQAYIAFNKENLTNNKNHIYSFVQFKKGLDIKDETYKLAKEIGIKNKKNIILNRILLSTIGQLEAINWDLIKTSLILMIIGGMIVYSIYSISALRRIQEYGIMRAIGSTSKQIIYTILSEIGIIYIIGTLLGTIMGIFSIYLFKGITISLFTMGMNKLDTIVISTFAIKLSTIVSLVIGILTGIMVGLLTIKLSPMNIKKYKSQYAQKV
ncbi:ABC-type transport system, involved in lipoprotein release, permease component [Gottschalkia purinilytica]|uniref:ABC-type transport system, involved in lipoprotein release, permease component n=1 Tax=Gottschalkia purinilytica TaxID=1503 RepID=A0A0L0WDK7_GOTPU|nr:FtsX-like permease family protein [Gottschalkia purinilytica]KNF09559.1 ABC-type transport system, involved in lipoprotein release, permease component [Gottschalkia purinilytica]